jgi:hypothetical protein
MKRLHVTFEEFERSKSPRQRPRGPTVPSSQPLQSGAEFIPATTARPGRSIVQVRGSPAPRPDPQSRRPWPCTCARAGIVRDCRSSGARSQCAASAHGHRAARRAPSARGTVVGIGQLGLRQHGARHSFWENGDDWLACRALARKCPQGRKWALTLCGRHARPGRCFPRTVCVLLAQQPVACVQPAMGAAMVQVRAGRIPSAISRLVAVGTALSGRPPHRSGRAALPHRMLLATYDAGNLLVRFRWGLGVGNCPGLPDTSLFLPLRHLRMCKRRRCCRGSPRRRYCK